MARTPKSKTDNLQENEQVEEAADTPKGQGAVTYEKWKVEPRALGGGKWELTAIIPELKNVRIGAETADLLNEQSHNSKIHYFETGSINNGGKITVQR